MNETTQGSKTPDPRKEQLESRVHDAIVRCEGYRCWARQNTKHEWLDWHGNKLNVIEVVTVLA